MKALNIVDRVYVPQLDFGTIEEVNMASLDRSYIANGSYILFVWWKVVDYITCLIYVLKRVFTPFTFVFFRSLLWRFIVVIIHIIFFCFLVDGIYIPLVPNLRMIFLVFASWFTVL